MILRYSTFHSFHANITESISSSSSSNPTEFNLASIQLFNLQHSIQTIHSFLILISMILKSSTSIPCYSTHLPSNIPLFNIILHQESNLLFHLHPTHISTDHISSSIPQWINSLFTHHISQQIHFHQILLNSTSSFNSSSNSTVSHHTLLNSNSSFPSLLTKYQTFLPHHNVHHPLFLFIFTLQFSYQGIDLNALEEYLVKLLEECRPSRPRQVVKLPIPE